MKMYAVAQADDWSLIDKGMGALVGLQYFTTNGEMWTREPEAARLYKTLGQARARVTRIVKDFPRDAAPRILEFTLSKPKIIDDAERVKKAADERAIHAQKLEVASRTYEYEKAKAALAEAEKKIKQLEAKAKG